MCDSPGHQHPPERGWHHSGVDDHVTHREEPQPEEEATDIPHRSIELVEQLHGCSLIAARGEGGVARHQEGDRREGRRYQPTAVAASGTSWVR